MDTYLYPIIALAYLVLCVVYFRSFRESSFWGSAWVLFVMIGNIFDNLVLSLGHYIQPYRLEALGDIRILLHIFLIPTISFIALDILRRIQVEWADRVITHMVYHFYTFILTIVGIYTEYLGVERTLTIQNGVIQYIPDSSIVPVVSLLVAIPLLFSSLVLWKRLHWPYLTLGVLISLFGMVLSISLDQLVILAFSELLLMLFLVITEKKLYLEDLQHQVQPVTTTEHIV